MDFDAVARMNIAKQKNHVSAETEIYRTDEQISHRQHIKQP